MVNEDVSEEEWKTEMEVGEEIVELLSGRIYRTLPIALKELVSNSWDADATEVKIMIHKDKEQIAVMDNGVGMDKEKLKNYVDIALTEKAGKDVTPGGRPTIGQYGIGILSTLPFCRRVSVETTEKGSEMVHSLTISSDQWIDEDGRRKPPSANVLHHECDGITRKNKQLTDKHGTTVIMEDVFPQVWEKLMRDSNPKKTDLMGYSGIDRIGWYLGQYAPIEYHTRDKEFKKFFNKNKDYEPMKLYLNGERVYRNAIENPDILEKKENLDLCDGEIKCKYMIVTPGKSIVPEEMRGLQLRMRNVAIGLPRHFRVYERVGKLHGRMRYIYGEIEILEGLENQLNLDREDIISSPEWEEFSEYFRNRMAELAESIELKADAEKSLGALAYSLGVPLDETEYGFVDSSAVRNSTKERRASKAESKSKLKKDTEKRLEKVGYSVKEIPSDQEKGVEEKPITVDHEDKIVYIQKEGEKGYPLLSTNSLDLNEIEKDLDTSEIAHIYGNKIAFNYNHPIFDVSKDNRIVKALISILYNLYEDDKISDRTLQRYNKLLVEVSQYYKGRG